MRRAENLTTFMCRLFENWALQTPRTLKDCKGILTLNIPILFEVQIDYFHIHNVDESVLRKIYFITGCPIKSNKHFIQKLVCNVEYESIFIK